MGLGQIASFDLNLLATRTATAVPQDAYAFPGRPFSERRWKQLDNLEPADSSANDVEPNVHESTQTILVVPPWPWMASTSFIES